jgi:hypothetical protein
LRGGHTREKNGLSRKKIRRVKPVLADGGRDIAFPRELVKHIRLKRAF